MTYRTMYADVSEEQLPANTDPAIYRNALGPLHLFFPQTVLHRRSERLGCSGQLKVSCALQTQAHLCQPVSARLIDGNDAGAPAARNADLRDVV